MPMHVDGAAPLWWTLDFNVEPMSSLIVQKHGEDVWVLDEIVLSRATTEQACEEFHQRYANHQAGVVVYGDASGGRLQTSGTTDYRIIQAFLALTQAGFVLYSALRTASCAEDGRVSRQKRMRQWDASLSWFGTSRRTVSIPRKLCSM